MPSGLKRTWVAGTAKRKGYWAYFRGGKRVAAPGGRGKTPLQQARAKFNRQGALAKKIDKTKNARVTLKPTRKSIKRYDPSTMDVVGVDTKPGTWKQRGGKKKTISRRSVSSGRRPPAPAKGSGGLPTLRTKRKAPSGSRSTGGATKQYRFGVTNKSLSKKYAAARKAEGKLAAGVSGPLMPGQGRVGGTGYRRGYRGDAAGIGPAISVTADQAKQNIADAQMRGDSMVDGQDTRTGYWDVKYDSAGNQVSKTFIKN